MPREEILLRLQSPAAWYTSASVMSRKERAEAFRLDLVRVYMAYVEASETSSEPKSQRRYLYPSTGLG